LGNVAEADGGRKGVIVRNEQSTVRKKKGKKQRERGEGNRNWKSPVDVKGEEVRGVSS